MTVPAPQSAPLVDEANAEQFLRDTAVAPPAEEKPGGWLRAARLEAVDREPDFRF